MATLDEWIPFGVHLILTATATSVTRSSATEYKVTIKASWKCRWDTDTNYGMTASSGGESVNLNTFGNYERTGEGSFTGTYSISAYGSATKEISVKFRNYNTDKGKEAFAYVKFNVKVPAWTSYTVKYNANGGTGAPGSQTKWKDESLTLSSTKPTRTGYSFQGWGTSANDTSVDYAPGANYTVNDSATLHAIWKAVTYTVTFNANGGTGAPSAKTKTHGTALSLSGLKATRTGYTFKGWATSKSGSAVYCTGVNNSTNTSYTANAGTILFAVWESSYKPPIFNIRSYGRYAKDENGEVYESDEGGWIFLELYWEVYYNSADSNYNKTNPVKVQVLCNKIGDAYVMDKSMLNLPYDSNIHDDSWSGIFYFCKVTGTGDLDPDSSYSLTVILDDSYGTSSSKVERKLTVNGREYPIEALAKTITTDPDTGETSITKSGVAFGKPAELEGVADFAYDAKFNNPVYGKALGMDRLPEIPENGDLNTYLDPGCWAVHSNAEAETIANIPVERAGRLEVWSSTGEGVRIEQYSYLRQRFVPYNMENAIWERDITRGANNVWTYKNWYRSTLTPAASEFVYHEPKILWGADLTSGMYMTAGHKATLTEKVSAQRHGIVLVFSAYGSASDTNFGWQTFFIPKQLVAASTSGHTFILGRGKFTYIGTKYLYIGDTQITGHDDNNLTGSNNGITYANNKFVLRYVYGV